MSLFGFTSVLTLFTGAFFPCFLCFSAIIVSLLIVISFVI